MIQDRQIPPADPAILKRFYSARPLYAAYPSADWFVEAFGPRDHACWLRKRGIGGFSRNLALYVHLGSPGYREWSHFGYHNPVAVEQEANGRYLDYVQKELQLQSSCLDDRAVVDLHWGGDTAALIGGGVLGRLLQALDNHFDRQAKTGHSVQVDPVRLNRESVPEMVEAGVNQLRISFRGCESSEQGGLDQFRLIELTEELVASARSLGIGSIDLDVVFGAPEQTVMSFNWAMRQILAMAPERLSLHDFSHMPEARKLHRKASEALAPAEETRTTQFAVAVKHLSEAGYVHIGMDQFTRPDDELAVAQRQGRLRRNLQGYCVYEDCDLLGLGTASLSAIGPAYSQNAYTFERYFDLLDENLVPVTRGIELSADDLARRTVMDALMCHSEVAFESLEIAHLLDFREYFASELEELKQFVDAGLINIDDGWLTITDKGRYVVWTICQVFDRYLRQGRRRTSLEKVL